METYIIIIDHCDTPCGTLYGAFVPDMPGCAATAASPESAIAAIELLLRDTLLSHVRSGGVLPKAKTFADLVSDYALSGEDLLSPQSIVVGVEVSHALACSVHQITAHLTKQHIAVAA